MPHDHSAQWERMLRGEHPLMRIEQQVMTLLPSNPRCKVCRVPFAGFGGRVMRLFGRRPWHKNPSMCNACQLYAETHPGGGEVELGMLFADIRGSTAMAERMTATEFNALLNRFYAAATDVLLARGAWIDKLVGDEVVAFFLEPGANHAQRALEAARALLAATGSGTPDGPWVPVGIGVHHGTAYVGTVGSAGVVDVTAVGDEVNVAARLAAAAAASSIVVTESTCAAAHLATQGLERRELELKGKSAPVPVRILRA